MTMSHEQRVPSRLHRDPTHATRSRLLAPGRGHRDDYGYAFSILKTLVPHLGQTPVVAGLLFLRVTFLGFLISTLPLHFTQYACAICLSLLPSLSCTCRQACSQAPGTSCEQYRHASRRMSSVPETESQAFLCYTIT